MSDQYFEVRRQKLAAWAQRQIPYIGRFEKTHSCREIASMDDGVGQLQTAGRLMSMRVMGKLCFANLQDESGRLQLALKSDVLGAEDFKFFMKNLDIGDHIGVLGETFTTMKGEKTLTVQKLTLLSKGLRPLPEKWHGLQDAELKSRYRYLDLIMNPETREKFRIRHNIIKEMRGFLDRHGFVEVETPILQAASSGAAARPFQTHHNALDISLFLRIAPETYLKRLIAGGYERVYEMGRCFRNEGIDPSHLQEFTMLEFYAAYWNYRDNMRFIRELIQETIQHTLGTLKFTYQGQELDFSGDWKEISYRDLILEHAGIDILKTLSFEDLKAAVVAKNLDLPVQKYVGKGSLMDALYKKYCRPHLIDPVFLTLHPSELVPLARRSDEDPQLLDMFQVVVNGWEIVKAYSELVDPVEQKNRLLEQADLAAKGDEEAMMMEEDFVLAMEYGMPPISGLGLGIERFVALLTDSPNIRDVIYFPSLKPPTEAVQSEEPLNK
jgi:lysyl-tRNA synthetase class 2